MIYCIIDSESDTCIGSGTLDECMDFVQSAAFNGITGFYVINSSTGEVVS